MIRLVDVLKGLLKGYVSLVQHNENLGIVITLKNPFFLRQVVLLLKMCSSIKCTQLLDVWASDFPNETDRFQVNYLLLSQKLNCRILLRVRSSEIFAVPSVSKYFPSAGWLEREVWDMYGVMFKNHPELRRILTDYGFEGFPLRKDFPITGYTECRYDDELKRVVLEPIVVSQEYRFFDYLNPWTQNKE